jgi:hypothetical protein
MPSEKGGKLGSGWTACVGVLAALLCKALGAVASESLGFAPVICMLGLNLASSHPRCCLRPPRFGDQRGRQALRAALLEWPLLDNSKPANWPAEPLPALGQATTNARKFGGKTLKAVPVGLVALKPQGNTVSVRRLVF